MKYRKKPVVIEAMQWGGNQPRLLAEFLGHSKDEYLKGEGENFYIDHSKVEGGLIIKTLEDEHLASIGDWIIKGVNGEFYPCKPDIFEKTYDKADEFIGAKVDHEFTILGQLRTIKGLKGYVAELEGEIELLAQDLAAAASVLKGELAVIGGVLAFTGAIAKTIKNSTKYTQGRSYEKGAHVPTSSEEGGT